MSKIGRPTNDPKNISCHFRLSFDDMRLLTICAEKLGTNRTEIIRQGIREVYAKIKK